MQDLMLISMIVIMPIWETLRLVQEVLTSMRISKMKRLLNSSLNIQPYLHKIWPTKAGLTHLKSLIAIGVKCIHCQWVSPAVSLKWFITIWLPLVETMPIWLLLIKNLNSTSASKDNLLVGYQRLLNLAIRVCLQWRWLTAVVVLRLRLRFR